MVVVVVVVAAVVLAVVVAVSVDGVDFLVVEVLPGNVSTVIVDEAAGIALSCMAFPHFPEIGPPNTGHFSGQTSTRFDWNSLKEEEVEQSAERAQLAPDPLRFLHPDSSKPCSQASSHSTGALSG